MCLWPLLPSFDKFYKKCRLCHQWNESYEEEKGTYMLRALDLVLIYQQLKIPNFDFNVPTSFNIDNFKLKMLYSSTARYQIMWSDIYDGNTSDIQTRGKSQ